MAFIHFLQMIDSTSGRKKSFIYEKMCKSPRLWERSRYSLTKATLLSVTSCHIEPGT